MRNVSPVRSPVLVACRPGRVRAETGAAARRHVSPRFPDFVAPVVPTAFASTPAADAHARAWTFLQAGDLKSAERDVLGGAQGDAGVLSGRDRPRLCRAGRSRSEGGDWRISIGRSPVSPAEPSALVGRGEAHLALDNQEATRSPPSKPPLLPIPRLTQIARRVEVLKFRGAEQRLADARAAAGAGRIDEAIRAYTAAIASSPDSAFLYRELAGVERQRGDATAALAHFRTARRSRSGGRRLVDGDRRIARGAR